MYMCIEKDRERERERESSTLAWCIGLVHCSGWGWGVGLVNKHSKKQKAQTKLISPPESIHFHFCHDML